MWYRYRIKEVLEFEGFTRNYYSYTAQFRLFFLPFWRDIKPIGLGSNYGFNKKGAKIYIKHHKEKAKLSI